jgi:hypothetical protein
VIRGARWRSCARSVLEDALGRVLDLLPGLLEAPRGLVGLALSDETVVIGGVADAFLGLAFESALLSILSSRPMASPL